MVAVRMVVVVVVGGGWVRATCVGLSACCHVRKHVWLSTPAATSPNSREALPVTLAHTHTCTHTPTLQVYFIILHARGVTWLSMRGKRNISAYLKGGAVWGTLCDSLLSFLKHAETEKRQGFTVTNAAQISPCLLRAVIMNERCDLSHTHILSSPSFPTHHSEPSEMNQ